MEKSFLRRILIFMFAQMPDARMSLDEQFREPPLVASPAWFCLRSQPKHEHIAAGHLRQIEGADVFNPRMRFMRNTRLGPVTVTESMFPNYLFARFDWELLLNRVHYSPGVSGVVHFGTKWPTIPGE